MPQFTVSLDSFGNIRVESGVVIDISGYAPIVHYLKNADSFSGSADSNGASRWKPKFCGGSGRNIYIDKTPDNTNVPYGWYSLRGDVYWVGENQNPFSFVLNESYTLFMQDNDGNVIAQSSGPTFNPYGQIACSSGMYNGTQGNYYYEVDLGTATGVVTFTYDAYTIQDRFIVTYGGSTVIDTGLVSGSGSATFTKSSSSDRIATVKVIAPNEGTIWNCNLGCPGGGSPPYQPLTSTEFPRVPFSITANALGETIFGGPTTITGWYEGNKAKGQVDPTTLAKIQVRRTTIDFTSDATLIPSSSISGYKWNEKKFQLWTSNDSPLFFSIIDGVFSVSDATDIIAVSTAGSLLDPSGSYQSTEYGAQTYNGNAPFSLAVTMNRNTPMQDMVVYMTINFTGASIDSVEGPFMEFIMPIADNNQKHIPLAMIHEDLTIDQLSEGSIIWNPTLWGQISGTLSNQSDLTYFVGTRAPINSPTFTGTVTLPSSTSIGTVSSVELGYVDGVTSSIQTQLNSKAPL
jgi:hypothetical protein